MSWVRIRAVLAVCAMLSAATLLPSASSEAVIGVPAHVQGDTYYVTSSGTSISRAFAGVTAIGNLIVVTSVSDDSGSSTASIGDTQGNTYTQVVSQRNGGVVMRTFYTYATQATSMAVTVTFSETSNSRGISIQEFFGVQATNPVDQSAGSASYTGAGGTLNTGAMTTTSDGDLVYAIFLTNAPTINAGMTALPAGSRMAPAMAIQPSAGAFSGSATGGPYSYVTNAVAFKASAVQRTPSVNVAVDPTFALTVSGRATACNGETKTGSATGSTVSLGNVNAGTRVSAAQDFVVTSNALSGWTMYARTSTSSLTDGRGNFIAPVAGGMNPFPALGTSAFGIRMDWMGAGLWAPIGTGSLDVFTENNPTNPAYHCIAYQAQAASSTPAGSYSTTMTYTAVPRF